ncbi:actin-1, putative [Entamoeba invadens IP1]|uniref:actin-1, putative n=1 Tax=Entamoeba invadens IP1 TaxID=370355 RepID=UPI0002C3ED79|nr:actin-1, putative [Entamoeba invadens IP1]ELP93971.1 actin-1, putative [Entamoeba invadens IP1]|eukprot:XP_004260742.1 actin-1, putative [Entamoeba invadens IP1]
MEKPVVFDFGSQSCRVGFSGESVPSHIFPTFVGLPKETSTLKPDMYVGEILKERRRDFTISSPVRNGTIEDMSMVSAIIKHSFEVTESYGSPVLLTEPALNPKHIREKTAQLMFERFKTPLLYFSMQPILSLFAAEKIDGLVVDSGADVTQFIPVYEGFVISNCVTKQYLAGNDLLEYLVSTIGEKRDVNVTTAAAKEVLEQQVKRECIVAVDVLDVVRLSEDPELARTYSLPDGTSFTIEEERFLCPEVLFQPQLFVSGDSMVQGIDTAVYDTIMKCDIDLRRRLFENILCVGGNTMYQGFAERVQKGVQTMANETISVCVEAPEDRMYSSWVGGSIFASVAQFDKLAINSFEYEEFGAEIVNKKCKLSHD